MSEIDRNIILIITV